MERAKKSELLLNILWYAAVGAAVLVGVRFLLPGFIPLLGGLGLAVLGWRCSCCGPTIVSLLGWWF